METPHRKLVTRFAPSPTGFMHVGNVRTGLYSYLWAKKNGGTFILRIEDTDKEREVEGSIEHIVESLEWLGIHWDEGIKVGGIHEPYIQSHRLKLYKEYAQILIDKGYAYPDPFTKEEVETLRNKAILEKRPFLFREHRPETVEHWDGTKPLRFRVPVIKRYEWHDLVFGNLSAGEEALDDFILIKSDGYPTYNFSHIVDDIEMGVTHVMRGQEYISSTPKYLSLYEALGVELPLFATLPHVMGDGGNKKLGKRDGAKDLLEYRDEGYLPSAMVNFLALLGWNPGDDREVMTMDELIESFDIERVGHSGSQFNEEKLLWMNKEHLKKLSFEKQEEYIIKFIPENIKALPGYTSEMTHAITPTIMEHISVGADITTMAENGELTYYFTKPEISLPILISQAEKKLIDNIDESKRITKEYLQKVTELISVIPDESWMEDYIKDALWDYATQVGRGLVLWPMRYALSGREKSPDPFLLASILGKEETLARINNAISLIK